MDIPMDIFTACVNTTKADGGISEAMLRCISDNVAAQTAKEQGMIESNAEYNRTIFILLCSALVFFMQAGFAMLCAGAVRRKNLQNTMLKNLLDACGASLAFYSVGYAFAFGDTSNPNPIIGTGNFFLVNVDDLSFWLFQYAFSAASATIVAGTLAERCQMSAYFYYSIMLSGFVYPLVVHAVWSSEGFLSATKDNPLFGVGVVDFAGSGVVHLTGGVTALVATHVLGPRRGRFHHAQTGVPLDDPKPIQGHNIGLQMLGTLLLWFGWYGFNGGSALLLGTEFDHELAALAVANTTIAAGTAGMSAMFINMIIMERTTGKLFYDLTVTLNGVLSGLVAITAGCGVVEPWAAVVIGVLAGAIYLFSSWLLIRLRLDDAVDAIPVHFSNGMWGLISVGLFSNPKRLGQAFGNDEYPGFFYSVFTRFGNISGTLLGAQLVGMLCIITWTVGTMLPFFVFLDRRGVFRSHPLDEIMGLDKSFHGGVQTSEDQVTPDALVAFEKRLEKSLQKHSQRNPNDEESHPRSINIDTSKESFYDGGSQM